VFNSRFLRETFHYKAKIFIGEGEWVVRKIGLGLFQVWERKINRVVKEGPPTETITDARIFFLI